MLIPSSANVRPALPPTSPAENQRAAESPAPEAGTGDSAGSSSRVRRTKKPALQKQLLEDISRQQQASPPVKRSAQGVIPPAGAKNRMAALAQLNEAIRSDDDAKIIAACQLISHIVNTGPRINEKDLECLKELGSWLKTPQNTSEIKSLKALVQSNQWRKPAQQFAIVYSQTQMSMEDRIFGAVERLRKLMHHPDPASHMTKVNAAGLQWLNEILLTPVPDRDFDFQGALDAYQVLVRRTDNRPEEEIKRDIKDLRKLTRRWLNVPGKSPIKSLQAMVQNTDVDSVKQVIGEFTVGNSPQESTRELVSSVVLTLHRLAQEAERVSPHMSSGTQPPPPPQTQGQGTKRRAPEEPDAPPVQRARRETNSGSREDTAASDAAFDKELEVPNASPSLLRLLKDQD